MPELPDLTLYVERLAALAGGHPLEAVRLKSPFLVRSVQPELGVLKGRRVVDFRLLGKRIVCQFEGELFLLLHLMLAGRLFWRERDAPLRGKSALAALDFSSGSLLITEASSHKRASLYLVQGQAQVEPFDAGGIQPLTASLAQYKATLQLESRTLKRALTDPRLFSGIGNTYSDEILFEAGLSPVRLTTQLDHQQVVQLRRASRHTLQQWIRRLRREVGEGFPERVTAFRDEMAVHGRFGKPCPRCGVAVQRIRRAQNEANYCPSCQTGGKLLADRGLSRLLRSDWPKSMEELEEHWTARRGSAR